MRTAVDEAMKDSIPSSEHSSAAIWRKLFTRRKTMRDTWTKASLSAPRRRLLEAMQRLNFGRIEGLEIRSGEPVFQPAPRIIQDIKIGGENGPRPELTIEDFALKSSVIELFDHLSRIGDGTLESVEVKYGMPFKLVVEQAV
jgi:hypothetical protein